MGNKTTRRRFLHGSAAVAGGAVLTGSASAWSMRDTDIQGDGEIMTDSKRFRVSGFRVVSDEMRFRIRNTSRRKIYYITIKADMFRDGEKVGEHSSIRKVGLHSGNRQRVSVEPNSVSFDAARVIVNMWIF